MALDIAAGLAHLHASNVMHRDLKSKNVLLTREWRAKLADVGTAALHSAIFLSGALLMVWSQGVHSARCSMQCKLSADIEVMRRDEWQHCLLAQNHCALIADVCLPPLVALLAAGSSMFAGTLAWAAPELLLAAPCTNNIDIYSLGVVSLD